MTTYNVSNSVADDERIIDYVGGGADDQAAQVVPITRHGGSGVHEVHHEDVLEGIHNSTDLADLRSPLYDVEHYDLNVEDTFIVETESAPWDPGRVSDTAHQGTQRHASSGLPTFTSDATGLAHGYASSGYVDNGRFHAQHAHSSTNGINQWEDLSNGHESPEKSYSGHRIETASISSPPPSVWSASDKQYLSPTTQSSQHATQAGKTRSEGPTATSTTRSVQSAQPSVPGSQKPSGFIDSQGLGPSFVEVSVGPSDIAVATSLHVCFPCNKIFATRSGLRHHRETHDEAKMNAHRCPECQRGFRYPKDVERHLGTHEEEEDREEHLCPKAGCFKTFTRKDNLKRHLKKTLHG